jgi:hypothetical protein
VETDPGRLVVTDIGRYAGRAYDDSLFGYDAAEPTAEAGLKLPNVRSSRVHGWNDQYVRGPSLYFVVVSDLQIGSFVDSLGTNRWPVETARVLPDDFTAAVRAADQVAFDCDGAVLVAADGTIQEQMVRVRSAPNGMTADASYADWMSAKHLSAVEASVRDEVLAVVTLSEETGRVTVFEDGDYKDYPRADLGGRWRVPASDSPPRAHTTRSQNT